MMLHMVLLLHVLYYYGTLVAEEVLYWGGGGGVPPSHPCSTAQLAMGDMFHDFKMFRLLFRTKFAHTLSLMIIQTDDARVK